MTPTGRSGTLFVISAPSGGGKTTLARRLVAETEGLTFSVSHTTRPPRAGEVDGEDYHFVEPERFARMVEEGAFLEHARVFGQQYGTAREPVEAALASGQDLLLDIDVQGAAQIRDSGVDNVRIFVLPPDFATLTQRLRNRRRDSEEEVQRRLSLASQEALSYRDYDYLVINEDLDRAVATLVAIVRSERHRASRCEAEADRVLATIHGTG